MSSYKLRPETIIDIIEKVPDERVDLLMSELTEMIHQSKMSYDLCKALDPQTKAVIKEFVWKDDGKGEVSVTHSIGDKVVFKTSKSNNPKPKR